MMRHHRRILQYIVLAIVAALVLSLGEPIQISRATTSIVSLPFSAFYTETYGLPPCTPQSCPYPGHGTGFTTATASMTETTLLTLMPGPSSLCDVARAQTTFTDATGNQLKSTASGSACPTATNGPLLVNMSFTISGGTGKYVSASGSGTESGEFYLQNTVGSPVAAFTWKGFYTPCSPCA